MNNRTMPEDNAAFSTNTVDVLDLCSPGMDRALGTEKASLDKTTRYKRASRFAPILGNLFNAATQALASCMKLQLNWMTVRALRASEHVGTAASSSGNQAKPTAEVLERSMDIAIGPQHVAALRSTAASSSSRKAQPQLQPTPDELAYSMDIAIGERVKVSGSTVACTSESQSTSVEVPESSSASQWLRGRTPDFKRFHPSYRIVDGAAFQVVQEAKPLAGPRS